MNRILTIIAALTLGAALSLGAIACGGDSDDDPGASQSVTAEPDPEADPEAGEPEEITPAPKPGSATQIDVVLKEWEITLAPKSVKAGKVYFLVENAGPEDAHEFVVIKSDLAPGALPTSGGAVPEDNVDLLGEIEPFAPGSTGSLELDLEAGSYVLICNIAELEDGRIESHYEEGMRVALTVTE